MKIYIIKKYCFILLTSFTLLSCSTSKLFLVIPDQFEAEAEKMQIEGLGNGNGKKSISFGNYTTSQINRGWNVNTSKEDRNTNVEIEERLLRAFNINKKNITSTQKDQFNFTIKNSTNSAQVFALERKISEETRITTNNRWLSDFNKTKNFQYSFSAVIYSKVENSTSTWNLLLYSNLVNKTSNSLFDRYDTEEEGFLTNDTDTIIIKSFKSKNLANEKGEIKNLPFIIPTGYELLFNDQRIGMIDFLGKIIWMNKKLDEQTRIAIAAGSSAILLRRIQN